MDSNDPSPITVVNFDAREVESGVFDKRFGEGGAIGRCGVCGCFVALIASCQMVSCQTNFQYFNSAVVNCRAGGVSGVVDDLANAVGW